MPAFEQEHQYLLELSNIFKPTSQYSFDHTLSTIDKETAKHELWEELIDGSIPLETINSKSTNWYMKYWHNCTAKNL